MATSQQEAKSELGSEPPAMLEPEQITANRYYIQKIAETIQHLAVRGLLCCGMAEDKCKRLCKAETEDPSPDALFGVFFLLAIKLDKKLQAIVLNIPANASYTSPDIANDVVSVLGSMVLKEIASRYKTSDVNLFSVKAVETRDINGPENISIVVRFVKDGRLAEHLLGLHALPQSTADCISDRLLQVLTDCGFHPEQLVTQSYDGACMMAGLDGGVQKAIQEKLGRAIPYVHASDHQLELVIVQACSKIRPVQEFLYICKKLYNYIRESAVVKLKAGTQLKRLLGDRWSGYLAAARAINDNFGPLLILLESLKDSGERGMLAVELQVRACGMFVMCEDVMFVFSALLMQDVFAVLQPGVAALQDKDTPLGRAVDTVNACISLLKERRSNADVLFEELWKKTTEVCEENDVAVDRPRCGWKKKEEPGGDDTPVHVKLRKIFIDVHDYCISEAEARFSNPNGEYLSALGSLVPSSSSFLEVKAVKPLLQLVGADEDTFAVEAEVVKCSFLKPTDPLLQGEHSVHRALAALFTYKNAFPNVYRVLAAAVISGAFADAQESVFPCLTHILQPERFAMSGLRLNSLVLLSYENSLAGNITMEAFLDKFRAQQHRLQL